MSLDVYWAVVNKVIDPRTHELVDIINFSISDSPAAAKSFLKSNQVHKCTEEDLAQTIIINNNPTTLKELLENTKKFRDL